MMGIELTPEEAASCHLEVVRCLGNTARGNDVACHPDEAPGRYHVRFACIMLNGNLMTFQEAKDYCLLFHHWLSKVIAIDRVGTVAITTSGPRLLDVREVDTYHGRHSWIAAEGFLKTTRDRSKPKRYLWKDPVKCRYGWVHETQQAGEAAPSILVVPVTEVCHNISVSIEEWVTAHPEAEVVYP